MTCQFLHTCVKINKRLRQNADCLLFSVTNNSEPMNLHYNIEVIGLNDVIEYEQILKIELIANIFWEVVIIERKICPGRLDFRKIDW